MGFDIENEHHKATIKALADAHALFSEHVRTCSCRANTDMKPALPKETLKAIADQQGDGAAAGIVKMLFEEGKYLLEMAPNRWQDGDDESPSLRDDLECFSDDLMKLCTLPEGPQGAFDIVLLEAFYHLDWKMSMIHDCQDEVKAIDDLMVRIIWQQCKQKATGAGGWDPEPWAEKLREIRNSLVEGFEEDESSSCFEVFEESLNLLEG